MKKRILALLLAAVLLAASCAALADEGDARILFTFSAEFEDPWNSVNAVNGFLSQYPISVLETDEADLSDQMYRIVRYSSAGAEDRACVKKIALTGKKYASYDTLYIFQFLTFVLPMKGDVTADAAEAEFFAAHPDAEKHLRLEGQYGDAVVCLILYSEPYVEP